MELPCRPHNRKHKPDPRLIRRNIKTKMSRVCETAYNTIFRQQLEYASAVWDPHTDRRINQIEQKRAARWTVCNLDRQASVTRVIQELGWITLERRRADARLCLFYKVIHFLVALPLPDHVQYSNRIPRYCHSFRQGLLQIPLLPPGHNAVELPP